jgi:ribulose-phosphate 3-epimerase
VKSGRSGHDKWSKELAMTEQTKIAPSMLAADFSQLGEEVQRVADAGADLIHLDVMDGHFVPNLTMGPRLIGALRQYTAIPFDVHLMITHPQNYIDAFADAGADLITFHSELGGQVEAVIEQIKARGIKAGVALRPKTPISVVAPYLPTLDLVLLMSVEPGFGGQQFMMSTLEKLDHLRAMIQTQDVTVEIEVDGGINRENAGLVRSRGATILVAGTAIFGSNDVREAIDALRNAK